MKKDDLASAGSSSASPASYVWRLDYLWIALLLCLPNLPLIWHLNPSMESLTNENEKTILWLSLNLALLGLLMGLRAYLLQPLAHIAQHIQIVRMAYPQTAPPVRLISLRSIAREATCFSTFALEYYRKHHELSLELDAARNLIARFTLQQETLLQSTHREIATQYCNVLAYANYLEERVIQRKLDPTLRYDFDDICESGFNLKLIAGALGILNSATPPILTSVSLAALIQQTMLALAPALDRRSMSLTSSDVDMSISARGDASYLAHILWMMLLGMIRYADDESTLRIRCLRNHAGNEAIVSIIISELSPSRLTQAERGLHLSRKIEQLSPHMFAEAIRLHANIQLAEILMQRLHGNISILPLTPTSCEICLTLPLA